MVNLENLGLTAAHAAIILSVALIILLAVREFV